MPVIVVGADTHLGEQIIERFIGPDREVRAFVTDPGVGSALRSRGVKVAVGDISDDSHLAAACLNCFTAVLVMEAATDDRDRGFASGPEGVLEAWAAAVESAAVRRLIWVGDAPAPPTPGPETAVVRSDNPDLVESVYALDERADLVSE
ncbi:MAG: NAD(P)H-binding protein [Acidimicrobiia bacterium]